MSIRCGCLFRDDVDLALVVFRPDKKEGQEAKEQLAVLRTQLTKLEAKDRGLTDLRLGGEIDAQEFARRRTELRDEQGRLKEAIEAHAREGAEQADLAIRVFELSQALEKRWKDADLPREAPVAPDRLFEPPPRRRNP